MASNNPEKEYEFNTQIEKWETACSKTLSDQDGTLSLIDKETGEVVVAKILFMYSTVIYSGYECRGIVKIGNSIGTVWVELKHHIKGVIFQEDNRLTDREFYNYRIKEIVEDMEDKILNPEAHHFRSYGIDGMKLFVKQYHAMQYRNNNPEIPYTEHLYGVASVLKTIAERNKEIAEDTLNLMIQAALGHDLIEDIGITEFTIECSVGGKVLKWILELTNPDDDEHTDAYMEKIASASEEARLIKYADLIENTSSFCYSLHEPNVDNPIQRATDRYLPILTKTTDVLANTTFEHYPQTAKTMQMVLKVYTDLLYSRIEFLTGE